MMAGLYVFLGGGIGSLLRFALSNYNTNKGESFPIGTFAANIIACLLLGYLISLQTRNNIEQQTALLLMTGFCGGFSTFSTFSAESLHLFQNNHIGLALFYIGLSIVLGLVAVYIGYKVQSQL